MTAGAAKTALAGALAEVGAALADADGEQLELPTRFAGKRAEEQREKAGFGLSASRGRGRPPGAQNKASRDVIEFLRRRGVDPLMSLARWAQHTPETLARELGCTLLEAFDRWKALQVELAPYFQAKKLPVDADGRTPPFLALMIAGDRTGGSGRAPWLDAPGIVDVTPNAESQQNQALSTPDAAVSQAPVSHDEPK